MHLPNLIRYLGISCVIVGIVLVIYAAMSLKSNLKPSLKPRAGGCLRTTGLYSIVRHPAYSGIVTAALGYSFWENDLIKCMLTVALFILFDLKSSIEEKWFEKTYSQYNYYKKQVAKKFIPWIY
jgi:protein-S-isoprenylcysteine O-methyltransferase Ste14